MLSKLLNTPEVIKAAAPYERLMIRVPEAYLLLRHYETTRPGLLVLDADGRRVTSIDLSRALRDEWKPADVAKKLDEARKAPALEHVRLGVTGGSLSKFMKSVSELPGVRKAESDADGVTIVAEAGAARPDVLEELAASAKVQVEWDEPVVVDVMRKGAPLDEDAVNWRAAPGVWYSQRATEALARSLTARAARVYVTRLLLDPRGIDALHPRVSARLEMRTFDILNVPKGGLGARVAAAPLAVEGVLAVRPDIFGDTEIVVGREGMVDWDKVLAAFREAGCPDAEPGS